MKPTRRSDFKRRQRGTAMLELGLLTPILFTLALSAVQLTVYVLSVNATQYAAYLAARAYQVYGTRSLQTIEYRHLSSEPNTNPAQTIAEAAAEKVIFESLAWEHHRISVNGGPGSFDRFYKDGNDISRDGVSQGPHQGVVRVNFQSNQGVEVTYCMPILFPGVDRLFSLVSDKNPCESKRGEKAYHGIAVRKRARFGVEPEVTQL